VSPEPPPAAGATAADLADLAVRLATRLSERGETLAVAETAAGGLISAHLVAVVGASAWFLGGAVAYGGQAKSSWLGLPPAAFAGHGVVSAEGALAMAVAVRDTVGASLGLAEVGIAGPQTGRRSRKGAGLAYLAVAGRRTLAREVFTGIGDRRANQAAFARAALELLLELLDGALEPATSPATAPAPALGPP
jgi:PncC family amidohydrolase